MMLKASNNKHAYLIVAHANWWMLEKLICALDYKDNDIFLHIDKKAKDFPLDYFQSLCKYSNIYIYQNHKVKWGNYSQVETELFLYKTAVQHGEYEFYHLLSGSDFPIKSQKYIHDYFSKFSEENFIQIIPLENETREIQRRVRYYHFFVRKSKKWGFLFSLLRKLTLIPQMLLRVHRNKGINFFYGANWSSLTHEFVEYLISQENWIRKTFYRVNSADELYRQTVIKKGDFKIHSELKGTISSISRYIDWMDSSASPRELGIDDFEKINQSNACFARKLGADKELVEKIITEIYKKE